MQLANLALIALLSAPQDPPDLAKAKSIDQEILKLKDLPDDARLHAIEDLSYRIERQPARFKVALALNLATEAQEATTDKVLQEVTNALADALRNSSAEEPAFAMLAQLAHYSNMQVSTENPGYLQAMAKLEAVDRIRNNSDFALTDIHGKPWNLRSLRGKVVLLNFWATWCPPCRKEIPDLNALQKRFKNQDLVILSISDEEKQTIQQFAGTQRIRYPLLLDPGHKVKDLFQVTGLPHTLFYDREGHLAAQALDRLTMQGFLDKLAKAGLP